MWHQVVTLKKTARMTQYFSWSRATWTTRSTHSWMVPPQSLLPDGQGVVQQVGRLLVFILIPARTHKANALSQNGREKRLQAHCLAWRAANVDFLGQFPQLMRHQLTSVSNLTVIVPPPGPASTHNEWTTERMRFVEVVCERRQKKKKKKQNL